MEPRNSEMLPLSLSSPSGTPYGNPRLTVCSPFPFYNLCPQA